MPTLNECADKILKLADAKGFSNDPKHAFDKLAYGMIELANAMEWLKKNSFTNVSPDGLAETDSLDRIPNEIIDTMFYCLHALRTLCPTADIDQLFERKYAMNMKRQFQYGLSEERKGT